MSQRSLQSVGGFTVFEIMITLTIAAILLSMGIPAFQDFSLRQRMNSAVSSFQSDLLYSRSQAVYRDMHVVLCPGTPVKGCVESTNWSTNWIVFSDTNQDRQHQATESLLRHGQGTETIRIHSSAGRSTLRFYPNGSAPGSNSSISFCGSAGPKHARKLIISNLGRVRRENNENLDPKFCP